MWCCATGAIDDKYDIAISTACGPLDNIVVDTLKTGQQCVDYLKRANLGVCTFILLEKMEQWVEKANRPIKVWVGLQHLAVLCWSCPLCIIMISVILKCFSLFGFLGVSQSQFSIICKRTIIQHWNCKPCNECFLRFGSEFPELSNYPCAHSLAVD